MYEYFRGRPACVKWYGTWTIVCKEACIYVIIIIIIGFWHELFLSTLLYSPSSSIHLKPKMHYNLTYFLIVKNDNDIRFWLNKKSRLHNASVGGGGSLLSNLIWSVYFFLKLIFFHFVYLLHAFHFPKIAHFQFEPSILEIIKREMERAREKEVRMKEFLCYIFFLSLKRKDTC